MFSSFYPLRYILTKLRKDHVSAFAGQSAYFTVLSALPFLMFILTLIQRIPVNFESLFKIMDYIIPEVYEPALRAIFYDIQNTASTAVLSISLIIAIWTAAKGILALSSGLNVIYGLTENRNYVIVRIQSMFYTFFFALIIIVTMVSLIFGNHVYKTLLNHSLILPDILNLIVRLRPLIAFAVFFIICTLFYAFLPSEKQALRNQLTGAFFTAFAWMSGAWAFSFYLNFSNSSAYLYGSLSYLILFLIYLYLFMYLFFFGAEINWYMNNFVIGEKTG